MSQRALILVVFVGCSSGTYLLGEDTLPSDVAQSGTGGGGGAGGTCDWPATGSAGGGGSGGGATPISPDDCAAIATRPPLAYWYCPTNRTWDDAEDHCAARGGTLAKVADSALEAEILPNLEEYTWIGLHRAPDAETFVWLDGTPARRGCDYTNWNTEREPNNDSGTEYCVHMQPKPSLAPNWNDRTCADTLDYLCEVEE